MIGILFTTLAVLFVAGVPIAIAVGLSGLLAIWLGSDIPLTVILQRQFTAVDSFPLMAIPFFILAGTLMEAGGISKRLVQFGNALIGHATGGLAIVSIVASMFFAAISGSTVATVAAIGMVLIPAMKARGYRPSFAGAVQASAGNLGIIIPPSIAMVVYGVATNTSISAMFIGGFVPGFLMTGSLMLVAYLICKKRGYSGGKKSTFEELVSAFRESILALLMPIIILGGIYGGIFTPTEAAAVAVAYAFIIGTFVYKELNLKKITELLGRSVITTAGIMFLIATAGLFAWILTRINAPNMIAEFFLTYASNKYVFLLYINVILFIVGMFFETTAANVILAPLLAPIAIGFGIDPIHFGLIMIVNLAVGMCTPPLGVNLFVACQIADIRVDEIIPAVMPFLLILILDILIISYVPAIVTWLPGLL